MALQLFFWIGILIVFYTYIGYGLVLFIIIKLKRLFKPSNDPLYDFEDLPPLTLIVACYNEADILEEKIKNTLALKYPENRLSIFFVTDGSTDHSGDIINKYEGVELHHKEGRSGKVAAVNRVMEFVKTPIVAFCDANTFLNEDAMFNLVRHYKSAKVGAIAGEKKIMQNEKDHAAGSGEGAYWKYESMLKKWDSELYTVVGAAGELFSVRTELYEHVPGNIIIEDFYLSMSIVKDGYRVIYEPDAYAMETSSASVEEEEKRKVRIAAGGIQSIVKLSSLLNFFKYGIVTFQYISHRVLRWTLTPLLLPLILIANILLVQVNPIYMILLGLQIIFYAISFIGYLLRGKEVKSKLIFIPYYFTFMNISVYKGFKRYMKGQQSVVWEQAKRAPQS